MGVGGSARISSRSIIGSHVRTVEFIGEVVRREALRKARARRPRALSAAEYPISHTAGKVRDCSKRALNPYR